MNEKEKRFSGLLSNRVAQFMESEKRRNQTKPSSGIATPISKKAENNPYMRARIEILTKHQAWRRNEILEMERLGDTDNRFYMDFVREVAKLGDIYMPIVKES